MSRARSELKFPIPENMSHYTSEERDWLIGRIVDLERALNQIIQTGGKVCENYELCTHESCQASVGSWFIATAALQGSVSE